MIVEAAICLPLLFIVFFGIVGYGLSFRDQAIFAEASRYAARAAAGLIAADSFTTRETARSSAEEYLAALGYQSGEYSLAVRGVQIPGSGGTNIPAVRVAIFRPRDAMGLGKSFAWKWNQCEASVFTTESGVLIDSDDYYEPNGVGCD